MIIRFGFTNFRSYKKENVLDFVSKTKIKRFPEHERKFGRLSVVKNIGIFGSNAFGKSNALNALGAMLNLITRGYCHENLSFIDTPSVPTSFDIVFLTDDNNYYEYSFSILKKDILNPYVVVDEQLYHLYLNGSSELIYSKADGLQDIDNEALRVFTGAYKNAKNQLFLRYINGDDKFIKDSKTSVLLRKIYLFFLMNVTVKLDDTPTLFLINKDNLNDVTTYLKKYDLGIKTASFYNVSPEETEAIVKDPFFDVIKSQFQNNPKIKEQYFSNGKDIYVVSSVDGKQALQKLLFTHKGIDSPFCYGYESNGTQRIFTLLALLFDKNNKNKTIAIDEIERSAFPGIASRLIQDFQDTFKDTNAQLLFSSHLDSLISTVLRRDEIYFVDKNAFGESRLYPLSDFRTATSDNIVKEFNEGSYGAIPKMEVRVIHDASN